MSSKYISSNNEFFNSTIIQYNQHALPPLYFHRWELWINYLHVMAHTISSCGCSWWLRRRGWVYVAALRGQRGGGRVVVCWRGAGLWSGGCVEARMSAAAEGWRSRSQHWWPHHHNERSYLLRERGQRSRPPQQHGALTLRLTDTHLDCGRVSVLSFNSSSETSVSRISGLDLFPYLRHTQRQTHGQLIERENLKGWAATRPGGCQMEKTHHREKETPWLNWARGK